MNCPSCQGALSGGAERCPSCGAVVAPVVLGNLAPDTSRLTPPARPASLRDLPGARKREKAQAQPAWKDEVRERVQKRRRKTQPETELPLFREPAPEPAGAVVIAPAPEPEIVPEPQPVATPLADAASEFHTEPVTTLGDDAAVAEPLEEPPAPVVELALGLPRPTPPDLPLRRFDFTPPADVAPAPPEAWVTGDESSALAERDGDEDEWQEGEDEDPLANLESVERPAQFAERVQAGAVDAAILAGLYAVVVYFASRAAKTSVVGLEAAWPWLAGYLGFLGLVYAAWFTGMRGQTPGKMMFGLLVLTQAGERPGWGPAVARALTGAVGIALAGLGMLPLFFDPTRRAFHDRLLRTRVVKV